MSASRPEDVLILEVLDLKNIVLVIFYSVQTATSAQLNGTIRLLPRKS